jgi:adenosyl cobinamide kinase/adenosyl cobinamide phosphate guanylyltransferase
MILIHGESRTGKSSTALNLLNKDGKSMYFALNFDKSIKKWATIKSVDIDVHYINREFNCDLEFDIEYAIFSKGSHLWELEQVVIDPINVLIKRGITLNQIIEQLQYIEKQYSIEIIAVMNTSFYLDEILKLNDCKIIFCKKNNKIDKIIPVATSLVGLRG